MGPHSITLQSLYQDRPETPAPGWKLPFMFMADFFPLCLWMSRGLRYVCSVGIRPQLGILYGVICLYLNYCGQWEKALQVTLKMVTEKEQPKTRNMQALFLVFYDGLNIFLKLWNFPLFIRMILKITSKPVWFHKNDVRGLLISGYWLWRQLLLRAVFIWTYSALPCPPCEDLYFLSPHQCLSLTPAWGEQACWGS